MIKTEFMNLYEELSALTKESEEGISIDLPTIDKAIQDHFGADTPGDRCIYITPNGKFINLFPELDVHEELATWLNMHNLIEIPTCEDAAIYLDEFADINGTGNFFADFLKYIQCRNDNNLCYIVLPVERPTFYQYECLEKWLNEAVFNKARKPALVEITCLDLDMHSYSSREYTSEDLIRRIKRCYSSGRLYENLPKNK
jgi:hypothetical protein